MLDQVEEKEKLLKLHSDKLEKDVAVRTAQLTAAKERAEEANRLKDKFVSLITHDLRSSIASSIIYLGRIKVDETGENGDMQNSLLARCTGGLERMLSMIDSLLKINRLQSGDMSLKKSFENPFVLCNGAVESLQPLADEKGIVIENRIANRSRIFVDGDLFEEVIRNLLSNAIKFSVAGDTVAIATLDDAPSAITISDSGVGIGDDILNDIFKKDVKTSTVGTAGEQGLGMGLLFCDDIMRAHGGKLIVESEEGTGSVFTAYFPEATPVILLVDDQESVRMTFKNRLKVLDAVIVEAENGQEALDLIEKSRPDLVIADIHMPVLDGFRFLEIVKGDKKLRDIPIIVATSLSGVEVRDKVFRLGANDYVSKPVMEEDLIPRVRRFIG